MRTNGWCSHRARSGRNLGRVYRRTWIAVFVIAALAGLALFALFQLYRELPSQEGAGVPVRSGVVPS